MLYSRLSPSGSVARLGCEGLPWQRRLAGAPRSGDRVRFGVDVVSGQHRRNSAYMVNPVLVASSRLRIAGCDSVGRQWCRSGRSMRVTVDTYSARSMHTPGGSTAQGLPLVNVGDRGQAEVHGARRIEALSLIDPDGCGQVKSGAVGVGGATVPIDDQVDFVVVAPGSNTSPRPPSGWPKRCRSTDSPGASPPPFWRLGRTYLASP